MLSFDSPGRDREETVAAATLDAFLKSFTAAAKGREPLADLIQSLADAAVSLRTVVGQGLDETLHRTAGDQNADGDVQHGLDLAADEIFLAAARRGDVAALCSEERPDALVLGGTSGLALAVDPLDGSSNIEVDAPIGSIFSVLPSTEGEPAASFLQPGRRQLAAGFFIYGPQLALALTLGGGTRLFTHSRRLGTFVERASRAIPERTQEFAINTSNYRHWDEAVKLYVDDCLKGETGPREKDFNMRWNASLVAEAYRILVRGGIFLYPGDARRDYRAGRLRLVYEANPIAMLMEQAGGAATDCHIPILDLEPQALHQRVPLVFGAAREVARVGRYHAEPSGIAERAPLFGNRGLFRA